MTNIEGFDLPMNFIFGVTESAQRNTHNTALLGFSNAMPQYHVNATATSKDGLTLVTAAVWLAGLLLRAKRVCIEQS